MLLSPRPHYENPGQEGVKTESEGFVSERCLCKARPLSVLWPSPSKKPNKQTNKKNPLHFSPLIYLFFSSFGWRSDDLMPCRGICRLSICSQFTSLVLIKWSPNGSSYKLCSGQGRVCVCVCFFWLFFAKLYELWWIASQMNLTDVLVSGFLFEAPINPQLNVIL